MIRIERVSKQFRLYRRPGDRVLEWLGWKGRHRAFWALRDVSLEIPNGRTVGIVGPNGAGKSTLLKIVTGTLVPSSGAVVLEGRVAALLELGAGFHPEFTGRQNIWVNGQLLGLTPEEIAAREQEIIEFSELGPFIDQPIRAYSSGMVVRLGFSVAASVSPDILIVDEALSVGDAHFSQKCVRRIRAFRERGTTILFVSHDPGAIVSLCDEAVLLDAGAVKGRDHPEAILEAYTALVASRGEGNVEMTVKFVKPDDRSEDVSRRLGTFQAMIAEIRWLTAEGTPSQTLISGSQVTLEIRVLFLAALENPTVGFLIRDRLGQDVYGANTNRMGIRLGKFDSGGSLTLQFAMTLNLGAGDYSLTTAVHQDETHVGACFDWTDRHHLFRVAADRANAFYGIARLDPKVEIFRKEANSENLSQTLRSVFDNLPRRFGAGEDLQPSPFLQGFYGVEQDAGGRCFRWTEENAILIAPVGLREIRLHVGAWGRLMDSTSVEKDSLPKEVKLELEQNGISLGTRAIGFGNISWLAWPARRESKKDLCVFRLKVSPPFREVEIERNPHNSRQLGVALLEVETL